MAQPIFQKSFNSGEWAPQLYSRVDIEKYHSGAALLSNFYVDYRGGASTRPGTKYILQAYKSATPVRLIPFQASFGVTYMLEFGDHYIRFFTGGAPVLETGIAITGASQANPCQLTVANSWSPGDWVYIAGVGGMTQLNGNYYRVGASTPTSITLQDLNGNPINSTAYSAFTSGGTAARVYTQASPYAAADLFKIKYQGIVNSLILCHPAYPPQELTLIAATNWVIEPITFGTTLPAPIIYTVSTTLSPGPAYYAYVATAVDASGNESYISNPGAVNAAQDLRTNPGSISVSIAPVSGAVSYNVYKSSVSYFGAIPTGVPFGFAGNITGGTFIDSNIAPDYSITPPIGRNPFTGAAVGSITLTAPGTYTNVPVVTISGGNPNVTAVAAAILQVQGTPTVGAGGTGYAVGDTITLVDGVVVKVATTGTGGAVATLSPITAAGSSAGNIYNGPTPTNPVAQVSTSGAGTGATINLVWGVGNLNLQTNGEGYQSTPTVSFAPSGATATATLSAVSNSYPSVPGFFQQRLVLAAANSSPDGMNFSQPGSYFNYNISQPVQADDAIQVALASGQLETIKSVVSTAPGLVVFTDKSSWLVNGGSLGSAISPSQIVANRQSFNGASDVVPILNNYDILYVEDKGSSVRDSTYNYYAQVFTGTDISVIASHLFFGYAILEWAWAYAPFRLVWCIRDDGVLLCLTFSKEEDFIAWSHHSTAGAFQSTATVVEMTPNGDEIDAIYFVVQRTINGNTVKYIERLADRYFFGDVKNAWCVDAAIQYNGPPTTQFQGAQHLAGQLVTGLADGQIIAPFVMPTNGFFTLPVAASLVTLGIGFTCQLKTLALDTGEPTVQGKTKKINAVTLRVVDTLGLQIGSSFNHLVPMQDLMIGNVGSMLTGQDNQVVSNLFTGDIRTFIDPTYTVPGQYCIQQSTPVPATVTGVMPQISVGDTPK